MTEIKAGTVKAQEMESLLNSYGAARDIWDAYEKPSAAKARAWREIESRAQQTPGYAHDLKITGASSHFFSTIYSYIEDGVRHIIRDTHAATYHTTVIPA